MSIPKKHNSINSQAASQMRLNQNSIELLTKIDQALNSSESYVTAKTVDSTGKEVTSQIPTLGFFEQKLDQLYKMVKTLAGIEGTGSTLQLADNKFKRVITADLNNEPKLISQLAPVSTFKSDPNWIFDTFLNPKISVELDLTDKIDDDTRNILSKRFIVEFESVTTYDINQNQEVVLTETGKIRKSEFDSKYKGKSNIDIVEFSNWLQSDGLLNKINENLIDQDYFRIEPNKLQFKGNFSVLSTDLDTINKKLWYILDTLTYYDISDETISPKPVELKIGDTITIKPNQNGVKSVTIYKVVEISTITSQNRVRFERVFGEEPIPIRLDAICFYSNLIPKRNVKISVGFNEYSVLFIKQINELSNVTSHDWSQGIGFYTNELRLDSNTGELFSDYYITKVNDYGIILEDLVSKKTPNMYGVKPNAPVLDINNFKVVQTNSHLTQTVEAEKIRDLHNQKNNVASEITQIQSTIEKQNRLISKTKFTSNADKKRATDDLAALSAKLDTKNQTKISLVNDILASKKNLNKITPTYNARGFFAFPESITSSTKTKPQEVVQFEIWYRKLSKSGDENPILTITDINNKSAQTSSNTNTYVNKTVNGSFSNWTKFKTDSRKRVQDLLTNEWTWTIEDISDANTPNINQLDIPILPGEKIEVRVKSLSEVGWPETPIESDFSNTIEIVFPDDLNNVLSDDQFILKEAQADDIQVNFHKDLESMGLNLHLSSAIKDVDTYYAHSAAAVASGFKDNNGKQVDLYSQLLAMVAKINSLEETITRAKGILEVYLINNTNKTKLYNGNSLSFNINLEDYMTPTKIGLKSAPIDSISRTYKNELIVINDYSLLIKNAADTASLGILSYRGYGSPSGKQPSTFAYDGKSDIGSNGVQAVWIKSDGTINYNDTTNDVSQYLYTPQMETQTNNQWIWLQTKDLNGNYIYNGNNNSLINNNNLWDKSDLTNGASEVHDLITSTTKNVGLLSNGNSKAVVADTIKNITDNLNWQVNESPLAATTTVNGTMGSTIHPVTNSLTNITDTSAQLVKIIKPGDTEAITIPINIYVKPFTGTGVFSNVGTANDSFEDSIDLNTSGDMPTTDVTGTGITRYDATEIEITLTNSSEDIIKIGDRVILSGLIHANLIGANNKLLTVSNKGVGYIRVKYSTTAFTATGETSVSIVQLHKKYNPTAELNGYNVLGKIGIDDRFVNNYLEIIPTSASPNPVLHEKKIRFLLEDENNIRPFEAQLNFNILQYKPTVLSNTNINNQQNTLSTL